MANIFCVIPSSAWSHEMRWYLPFTSFIGYFRRRESCVMPWSRTAAPCAECEPRLIGESNPGSWPTHTPFCTTASTAQPTEQCVQTVRLISILPWPGIASACALPIMLNGNCAAKAPAPSVTPERLRNVRRSIVFTATAGHLGGRGLVSVADLRVRDMVILQILAVR